MVTACLIKMFFIFQFVKIVIFLLAFAIICPSSTSKRISVTCKAGTFIGHTKTQLAFNNSYSVNRFLGIPYAEPPIDELRFKKPVKKSPLTKPYDAGEYGATCHGLFMEMEGKRKPNPMKIIESEDCLFLNIFTPDTATTLEKLPVIVVIPSGGFNLGSSTICTGDILSAYGNVVVVTFNYRLTIWGFLSTGDEASLGNYGLWDQHMAIEWVHENIETFGGDTSKITIAGYSAGSASVIYQAMYPKNEGLFKRVIAQSGSPLCPWAFTNQPRKAAEKAGRLLNCETSDSYELVNCIRSKSAADIMTALNKDEIMMVFPMDFLPVVDGEFVQLPPEEILNENSPYGVMERKLLSSYELLTGVTSFDGLMMITAFVGVHGTEDFSINKDEFVHKEVPKIADVMFPEDNSKAIEDLMTHEYFPLYDPYNDTLVREAFIQLSTDYVFGIQATRTANVHAAAKNKNTYFYLFDTLPSQHILVTPSWSTKPNHGDDLTYLFGFDGESGFTSWTTPYTEKLPESWELEFSKTYITIISNFISSGDPNVPNDVTSQVKEAWPRYTRDKQEAFQITRDWNHPVIQRPFAKAVNFWYHALPSVIKEIKKSETGYCEKPEP